MLGQPTRRYRLLRRLRYVTCACALCALAAVGALAIYVRHLACLHWAAVRCAAAREEVVTAWGLAAGVAAALTFLLSHVERALHDRAWDAP